MLKCWVPEEKSKVAREKLPKVHVGKMVKQY